VLLAIDIGNTNIAIGCFEGERLAHSWRLSSRRDLTSDEATLTLRGLIGAAPVRVHSGIVASVVPPLTGVLLEALRRLGVSDPLEVAPGIRTGIRIRFDNPQEVGADRIVNAVAAYARYGGPAVIVDLGTATTLDVITADGEYIGGVICPGPLLGAEALAARTARLPRVDLVLPPRVIGRNTVDSIRSGLVFGHAAMIEGLVRRIEEELETSVKLIATGGLGHALHSVLPRIDAFDPHLTLDGLRLLWERNAPR